MKKLIPLTLAITLFLSLGASTGSGYEPNPLVDAIVKLQPKIHKAEAEKIAKAIRDVYADGTCTVPWQLVISIAFHESTFRMSAVNTKTMDYGMMQISKDNITRLSLDRLRLMKDPTYSLKVACRIISFNQQKYSKRISYWLGMYRSGNALWKENIRKNAQSYDRMVRQTAAKIGYKGSTREIARTK